MHRQVPVLQKGHLFRDRRLSTEFEEREKMNFIHFLIGRSMNKKDMNKKPAATVKVGCTGKCPYCRRVIYFEIEDYLLNLRRERK
jgi:hypothetical protein